MQLQVNRTVSGGYFHRFDCMANDVPKVSTISVNYQPRLLED